MSDSVETPAMPGRSAEWKDSASTKPLPRASMFSSVNWGRHHLASQEQQEVTQSAECGSILPQSLLAFTRKQRGKEEGRESGTMRSWGGAGPVTIGEPTATDGRDGEEAPRGPSCLACPPLPTCFPSRRSQGLMTILGTAGPINSGLH